MSTITKELAKLFRKITNSEIDAEGNAHVVLSPADSLLINNARIALASLEAEPVGEVVLGEYDDCGCHPDAKVVCIAADGQADWENFKDGTRLYTAPPAPVSVPDGVLKILLPDAEKSEFWFEHDGKILFEGVKFNNAVFDACRAAMLQGAGRPQNEPQNIPENIPATQFKPVADLYGLTSPTGGETSFTFDAVEARDFIDGGWSCQEYVELERFQEAITNHTEDKLAMVDHSGDSNNMVEPVTTAYKLPTESAREKALAIQLLSVIKDLGLPENVPFVDVLNEVYRLQSNSPVIPDGLRLALSNADIAAPESDEMLAATCEKYIQALVTWVKDRKPFRSAVIPDGWVACSERMPGEVLAALQNVARLRRNLNDFCGDKSLIAKCLSEAEGALLNAVNRHSTMLAEPLKEAKNV
ncbi:hypothetical protein [Enterobacter hormaechei]|uniref:hypothetical protein n=1 Tax=Enterobacter hormaechei TaxID=158836 RepID=UPI0007A88A34|nr:hypothetical protein [Enterobacter hormaechei]SAJ26676.1 Uncharacterised protein [Enterobacter hormaechei]